MAISMLKIRRLLGRLIFNMGIAIPGKTVFLIETAPCIKHKDRLYRKKLNNPIDSNILKYKHYKNKLDSCLKKAMDIYYY